MRRLLMGTGEPDRKGHLPPLFPLRANHVLQTSLLCGPFFLGSSFCLFPPQAPWILRSPRLLDTWSKGKDRKQRWIGIIESWKKKSSSFWFTYRIRILLIK
ncbi:unnamed protein product [Gulo gulo]|uniref:Uncharacterized protein n=1 Tax=Gulo gulo TaxID=48420 RepID=A0A9X9Q2A6_GULGU|nr:unnamed protein product [Gulo gulo]